MPAAASSRGRRGGSSRRRYCPLATAALLLTAAVAARGQATDFFDAPAPPSPPSAFEQKPTAPADPKPSTDPLVVAPAQQPPLPPLPTDTPPDIPPVPVPAQPEPEADLLTLANTLGSHMVLQQGPLPACLYGTGTPMASIQVSIEGDALSSAQTMVDPLGNWVGCLPPQKAGGPHTITVAGSGGKRKLEDVWFGEVWLCGGQSNMQMSLRQVLNATKELQAAASMEGPPVRVLALGLNTSAEPLEDVEAALLPWSVASPETLGGPIWKYFSGACWFYGRHLAEGLRVPIGLVQAAYGSTELKAWSPPEALAACPPTPDDWAAAGPAQVAPEVAAGGGTGTAPAAPVTPPATPATPPATAPVVDPVVPPVTPPATPPVAPAAGPAVAAPPLPPAQQPPLDAPVVPAAPKPPATTAAPPADTPVVAAPPAAAPTAPAVPTTAGGNGNLRRALPAAADPAAAAAAAAAQPPPATTTTTPATAEQPQPEPEAPTKKPAAPRPWQTVWRPEPSTCFNAMAHPLRLMGFRGVIWDQGEEDVHHSQDDYRCLLPEFIMAWRRAFPYANALGPMPFGVFQLQGYNDDFQDITNNGTEVGRIRLAQYSALSLPKVFMAVGYDLNDDASPYGPVHFRDKQDVGRRLAQSALANVYGEWGSLPWGPVAKEVLPAWEADAADPDTMVLTVSVGFTGVGDGLVDSGVNIFELATDADADDYDYQVVEASSLALEGPEQAVVAFRVPKTHALVQVDAKPVLRYAYKNRPCPERTEETPYVGAWCGLYSSEEQPALPFIRPLQQ